MSSTVTQNRLPRAAIFYDESQIELVAQHTQRGVYGLHRYEVHWRDRQPALNERGYILRRRYAPDWTPSWLGTNMNPFYCEDSISSRVIATFLVTVFCEADAIIVYNTTKSLMRGGVKTGNS